MNLNELHVGMEIKNYKEFCQLVGEKEKSGKSKKIQISEWQRYMNLERVGQKIIVKEIFDFPVEKIDSRRGREVIPYLEHSRKLILDLLAGEESGGNIVFSKHVLLKMLNMTNENYRVGKNHIHKIAKMMELNENNVYSFFNETSKKLTDHLEKTLQSLRNQALIFWNTEYWISYVVENEPVKFKCKTDQFGNKRRTPVTISEDRECMIIEKRKATDIEVEYILKTEREVLLNFGYNNKRDIVYYGKYNEYIEEVCNKLLEHYNIEYHFLKYNITFHHKHIEREVHRLQEGERVDRKDLLNAGVIDRLYEQMKSR
jgi:hypothetical protein